MKFTKEQLIQSSLKIAGTLGIIAGLGAGPYSFFSLKPKLDLMSTQIKVSFDAADNMILAFETNLSALNPTFTAIKRANVLTQLLPETLIAVKGTLIQATSLLEAAGTTASKVKEGVVGIVLPQNALHIDEVLLRKTAMQLRLLSKMMNEIQGSTSDLSQSSVEIGQQISDAHSHIAHVGETLKSVRMHLGEIEKTISSLNLPTHAALFGTAIGGIFIFFGLCILTLASIYENTLRKPSVIYQAQKRAA